MAAADEPEGSISVADLDALLHDLDIFPAQGEQWPEAVVDLPPPAPEVVQEYERLSTLHRERRTSESRRLFDEWEKAKSSPKPQRKQAKKNVRVPNTLQVEESPYDVVRTPPPVMKRFSRLREQDEAMKRRDRAAPRVHAITTSSEVLDAVSHGAVGVSKVGHTAAGEETEKPVEPAALPAPVNTPPKSAPVARRKDDPEEEAPQSAPVARVKALPEPAPAAPSPPPQLKKGADPGEYETYMVAHYEWQKRHPGTPAAVAKRVTLCIEMPDPELRQLAVTTEDPGEFVKDLRERVCAQCHIIPNDPAWQLYIGSVLMKPEMRLKEFHIDMTNGQHMWFRKTPPGVLTQALVDEWAPGKKLPKKIDPNVARVFHDAKLKRDELKKKKNRQFLHSLLTSVLADAEYHGTPVLMPKQLKNIAVYAILKDPKKRGEGYNIWELEEYLEDKEFKEVFGCSRKKWAAVPFAERWARKRAKSLAY
jgi:hypothetical protein